MFDIENIIKTAGYTGLFGIVFAESGLLFGFFLPGDSLLFTAGILASQGYLNIYTLCLVLFVAAVLGDNVGYAFGKRAGPRIFKKEDSLFFHKSHILKAKMFFDKHGGKTIIIARFVPVVRTFAPIVAGVGNMQYTKFLFFNLIGAFFWAIGLTLLGFFVGRSIPDAEKYIAPIAGVIILISIAPGIIHALRSPETRQKIVMLGKRLVGR